MTQGTHGYGTQLQISDGNTPPVFTSIASITAINGVAVKCDAMESTDVDSIGGAKEFVAGIIDSGEVSIEANLIADASQLAQLAQIQETDQDAKVKGYRIIVPDNSDSKTATVSTTTWTATGHGWNTAQPVRFYSTGALPSAVIAGRFYFARRLTDDTFSIHATAAHAVSNTSAISSASAGTGTHTVKSGAKFTIEPFGPVQEDLRAATVAAVTWNSVPRKEGTPQASTKEILKLSIKFQVTGPVAT